MSRRLTVLALVPVLALAGLGIGLAARGVAARGVPPAAPSGPSAPVVDASEEPTPEPTVEHTPIPEPPPPDPTVFPTLEPTAEPEPQRPSYDVAAVQQRLTELRYYVAGVDGKEGLATISAVMAFQKVNGLAADGVVGPLTLAALESPVAPSLRGGPDNRIEVDLTKQVLYFVQGGALQRIMPVSSGSGATYRTAGGGTARSLTPVGTFRIERRIRGVRNAPLGTLYDPLYFYRGWAIHGSNHVPAYPASHGCVRLTRADAIWLFDRAPNGTTVILYGGTHTFTAGSNAAGTDEPAGDVGTPSPSPTATPTPSPTPTPTPSPTPTPTATPIPTAEPTPDPTPEPDPTPTGEPTSAP